ncbi:MAG: Uma2 family endonuclease [Leptolyngbyaceae cyanobacterium]
MNLLHSKPSPTRSWSLLTVTQAVPRLSQLMTMEDYLAYDDGTDIRYELENGTLIEMPTESTINALIARFLLFELAKYFPIQRIASKDTEIEVSGSRATCRLPDLLVHSEESYAALAGEKQSVLRHEMPAPSLIIEVVSPGKANRDRDYRYKHTEYAARGVAEYWIIDPDKQCITLCLWVDGQYEDTLFEDNLPLKSTIIPDFNLSTAQILAFGQA